MWGKLNIDPVRAASCILALQGLVILLCTRNSQKIAFFIEICGWVSCSQQPAIGSLKPQLQNLRIYFNIRSSKPVFQVLHSLHVSLPKACKHISVPCLLHVHNLLLFYEGYKSWSSRLCCFLQPAITFSFLDTLYLCLFDKIQSLMYALSQTYWPCVNTLQRYRILSFNEKLQF